MVNTKPNKPKQQQQQNVAAQKQTTQQQKPKNSNNNNNGNKKTANHSSNGNGNNNNNSNNNSNNGSNNSEAMTKTPTATTADKAVATTATVDPSKTQPKHNNSNVSNSNCGSNSNRKSSNNQNKSRNSNQPQQQTTRNSYHSATNVSYAQTVGQHGNNYNNNNNNNNNSSSKAKSYIVTNTNLSRRNSLSANSAEFTPGSKPSPEIAAGADDAVAVQPTTKLNAGDLLTAALTVPCAKCSKTPASGAATSSYQIIDSSLIFTAKQYRKSKSYVGNNSNNNGRRQYNRSYSDRRSSFDRNFAERNKGFVPIVPPAKPVLSSSNIAAVIADTEKLTIIERLGKGRTSYPIMQCGTLDAPDSSYHQQRSNRMDVYQIDDGFHSDGGTETPPPSPSSSSSIASTSDHGSLESVDTGGTQRLAVLSFEQVRKLHDVMDEKVAIHGRGNFPTLEVTLKDLVNSVRRKLEADVASGGAGVIVKDIRLNGGAASHVLAPEDQPYNDLDLIYAIELSSSRHFDRVKTAVLNTLLDLLPEGVSKRRIMPCALKEAYVGKMVKVNNNNDGDRWSLISLGNSPGHKNVELKFVDTMRRQFEFSVDSFQIVLDSLLLFYDCAALPISENFYPTVVGESVYGDFQEALYHLQKKLISTRQPEEIRGGGLLKYCNLLVRNYKPVDPQRIKTLERYMCSRFFIDFPDINTQTVKLEAYLRNHFWGVDEEPLQYQYLMHLREVVEMSTVCLMGHERRQTLLLIQSLAAQVLYKEQQKHQHQQAHEQYHQQQQQQQQQVCDMQQQQTVTLMTTQQQQQSQQQPQTIYVQQAQLTDQQQQQQNTSASVPQTIQIQAGPPGLIYANGVYYAPVIPTTICTCNSTWLST